MNCKYEDKCKEYIFKEQQKIDEQRKQLLGEKKNLLYYLKTIKYKREIIRKPDCDSMCWVKLDIQKEEMKNKYRG